MSPLTINTKNLSNSFRQTTDNHLVKIQSENDVFSRCQLDDFFYIEYSCAPLADKELTVCATVEEGFYLLYCEQGELELALANGTTKKLTPFISSLIYDKDARGIKLKLLKNEVYHFYVIGYDKPKSRGGTVGDSCYDAYKNSFCSIIPDDYYMYTGRPCLKLADMVKTISQLSDKDISSQFIMRGLMLEVLGIKLKHIQEVVSCAWPNYGSLTSREIEAVKTVAEFIREDSSRDFSIELLCRKTGLSPAKLQVGFKKMFNSTVINYIRDTRLERATELIKFSELNISEIVYSIGLTSRSYFSKIFRNKYNCSPKYFQDQNRTCEKLS